MLICHPSIKILSEMREREKICMLHTLANNQREANDDFANVDEMELQIIVSNENHKH